MNRTDVINFNIDSRIFPHVKTRRQEEDKGNESTENEAK